MISFVIPPAWYIDTIAPLKGGGGFPKYVTKVPSAKLGVMIPESLIHQLVSWPWEGVTYKP